MTPVLAMYEECRRQFPELTQKVDKEHIKQWDEVDPAFAYSWFESLANTINREMHDQINAKHYLPLFNYFRTQFLFGEDTVKNCIDVCFCENLFWQVPADKAQPYWRVFPDVLKQLYTNFHNRTPL